MDEESFCVEICEKRFAAIRLLYTILYHVKDKANEHLQEIFGCLLLAAKDEESFCVEYSRMCSSVLAHHASPGKCFEMILESLKEEPSESKLVVLNGFLKARNNIESNVLTDIAETL